MEKSVWTQQLQIEEWAEAQIFPNYDNEHCRKPG